MVDKKFMLAVIAVFIVSMVLGFITRGWAFMTRPTWSS